MTRNILPIAALITAFVPRTVAAATCTISPQSVSFGSYDTLDSQQLDGVGNISVQCDVETSFTIALSRGTGSYAARQMTSGADVLEYNLYVDPSRLTVWGDGSAGSTTVTKVASAAEEAVYGRVPPRQNIPAGAYTDTVVVTVTY
jgi:spore coat protein U-like protein